MGFLELTDPLPLAEAGLRLVLLAVLDFGNESYSVTLETGRRSFGSYLKNFLSSFTTAPNDVSA